MVLVPVLVLIDSATPGEEGRGVSVLVSVPKWAKAVLEIRVVG